MNKLPFHWEHAVGAVGVVMLIWGNWLGLFDSPPEMHMRDIVRILYVHVPAAWVAMVTLTAAAVGALAHLITNKRGWDWLTEAGIEIGVMQTALLILLGSIFARPTWGVWWDWDPRLTSSAVMLLTFVGVMIMRGTLIDPERRATWTSVSTIIAYINIPITYMSVRWWRSLHQMQSFQMEGNTVDDPLSRILWINTVAFTLITVWFLAQRWRIAAATARAEAPPELPPTVDAPMATSCARCGVGLTPEMQTAGKCGACGTPIEVTP